MSDQTERRRIRATCPHCGAVAEAPAEFAGRRVKCAAESCRRPFELPSATEARPSVKPSASNTGYPTSDDPFADAGPIHPSWSAPPSGSPESTEASNPGGIRFNPFRWCRYEPLTLAAGIGFAIFMFVVWLGLKSAGYKAALPIKSGGETPLWAFGLGGLGVAIMVIAIQARKFKSGDANPGVVISLDPPLVAVPTDMTQGYGEFPAIKIIRIKLKTSCGEPLRIGLRLPTVALYSQPPSEKAGHWSDFHPSPAEYATGDRDALRRLLASFPEGQYVFLKQALAVIEQPFRPGLYAMWKAPGKLPGRRINKAADF